MISLRETREEVIVQEKLLQKQDSEEPVQERSVTTNLQATYIGEAEPGYTAGQMYFLEVRQHWFGRITVQPTHGYRLKPLRDMRLVYRNLGSFFASWRVLQLVEAQD